MRRPTEFREPDSGRQGKATTGLAVLVAATCIRAQLSMDLSLQTKDRAYSYTTTCGHDMFVHGQNSGFRFQSDPSFLSPLLAMASFLWTVCLSFLLLATLTKGASPKKVLDVPFGRNYAPTWAFDHIKYINGGSEIQLKLDNYTGTGFQSKGSYLFGHFSMHIRMVPGDSAGTVTAFYLSSQTNEHDEIDFEFLGNRTGQPYILQTNVYTGGKGDKEQRIYLWFDPTKEYHAYSVLWNMYQIVFFVDDVPIRVFKNSKDLGLKFPFNQPMKIYSSLWNADDWATRGGLEKTDWAKAPFIASYKSFHVDGCEASVNAKFCDTQGKRWWDQKEFRDLDAAQYRKLGWVRQKYTIYNYCTDRVRFPSLPPECKRDHDI
ncbi:hypothetical protein POTOM_048491 [Populus tomentosa]|uniref:Xyloglucan endotransglucosylase/hydrolase n=1 Tax=Populus tomentosa TaxID=118781 RepID=A0A8X7YHN0_POPTO|nr:hypothetical protein POTOM_048491 [Populus tomentosa]